MRELAGRNCVITGASRGLGARIASAFWHAGASLLLTARSESELRQVATRLPSAADQRVAVLPVDLAEPHAAERIAAEADATLGAPQVLVNNAAVQGPIGRTWTTDAQGWAETFSIDVLAPVALCRRIIPRMASGVAARGRAKIINLSGGGATSPRANFAAYASAKAALVRFSETLAEEARDLGIDVNCVAPGAMDTAMLRSILEAGSDAAGEREVRLAAEARSKGTDALDRAAALCVFLASSRSDGITGKLISAVWDPWPELDAHVDDLQASDVYTLRRVVPSDRGLGWG